MSIDADHIARIEAEYGDTVQNVVYDFHWVMHEPLIRIASMFDIPYWRLRMWVQRWGMSVRRHGSFRFPSGRVYCRARALGYSDPTEAIICMRADGLRWTDIGDRLGCHRTSLREYTPSTLPFRYNLTPEGLRRRQDAIRQRTNRPRPSHPWRH